MFDDSDDIEADSKIDDDKEDDEGVREAREKMSGEAGRDLRASGGTE